MDRRAWLLALLLAGSTPPSVRGEPVRVAVRPGGAARWQGEAITSCSSGGRVWEPLNGACYFPVDLEASGTITVERVRAGVSERAVLVVGRYPYPEQYLKVDERMVHLSAADRARTRRESAEVARLWALQTRPRFALPLAPPLPAAVEGKNFGARRVLNGEPRSPHSGIDYKVGAGTPVLAVAPGRVVLIGDHFFAGRCVFVDHGGSLISMVFHLSRVLVEEGQEVKAGEILGEVGATGRATGPHLHLGFRWHGARVDPALFFDRQAAFAVIPP